MNPVSTLPRVAALAAECAATIRTHAEDFRVEELLSFAPSGEGGQAWLWIEKKDTNTDWLAKTLARFANVPELDVGFAGLKDRHAITQQWFSVKLEGKSEPDWQSWDVPGVRLLRIERHPKKLRRGGHRGNRFCLILRNVCGERGLWEQHLLRIAVEGVPNYFAEQRFGHQGANLRRVDDWWLRGRKPKTRSQRSLYLSAARSALFNQVLAHRVVEGNWNQALCGDAMMLDGSASWFPLTHLDSEIVERVKQGDLHPTGPLWGRGSPMVQAAVYAMEQAVLANYAVWREGLERQGLEADRRALRVKPTEFTGTFLDDNTLELRFVLPAGSYATAVLRELAVIEDAAVRMDNPPAPCPIG